MEQQQKIQIKMETGRTIQMESSLSEKETVVMHHIIY